MKGGNLKSTLERWVAVFLLLFALNAPAFVLIGNPKAAGPDDFASAREPKEFFRWNRPHLTYSFDASFVRYFGAEGTNAVHEAFRVINDFFAPEDGSYSGVSEIDLAKGAFATNYNTAWVNITAQNQNLIDLKSVVLGMIVNQLGVGNPHRRMYEVDPPAQGRTRGAVRLRNFDPLTHQPSTRINGVEYGYRLAWQRGADAKLEAREWTTDKANAWTAVAGITDAVLGPDGTAATSYPTLFGYGVYYDGMNAMGGKYQPRHALTFDDAAALRYLYRTNNFVFEDLSPQAVLVWPSDVFGLWSKIPIRGQLNFSSLERNWNWQTVPLPELLPPASVDVARRGGVDKIQFEHQPFDSLLGQFFSRTNSVWTDVFVSTNKA